MDVDFRTEVTELVYTVRQARRLAEKTQREMARSMGISRDTYRKIELNPEVATIEQAQNISRIVGIPMDKIIFARNST